MTGSALLAFFQGTACPEIKWWRHTGCFAFVVDCKPLAEVLKGQVPLARPDQQPIFERSSNRIGDMVQACWTPASPIAYPVMWHRREYNKVADYIVNLTMDLRNDWHKHVPLPDGNFKIDS